MLHMSSHGENALPPGYGVRPDNWVHSLQLRPDILRSTASFSINLEPVPLSRFVETRLLESSGQPLQKLLVRFTQAIIDLVPRCPEGVATCLWQLHQAEGGVIGGNGLEGNVGVPLRGVLLLVGKLIGEVVMTVELPVLDRRDGGDFGVVAAEFALGVEDGVDVQAGGGRAAGELTQAEDELFLKVVGEVVLGAEEDDAAAGDCHVFGSVPGTGKGDEGEGIAMGGKRTGNSQFANQLISIGSIEPLNEVGLGILAADDGSHVKVLKLVENTGELERLDMLSVLGDLLSSLVLDVDGSLDGSLDGVNSGGSHDGWWLLGSRC